MCWSEAQFEDESSLYRIPIRKPRRPEAFECSKEERPIVLDGTRSDISCLMPPTPREFSDTSSVGYAEVRETSDTPCRENSPSRSIASCPPVDVTYSGVVGSTASDDPAHKFVGQVLIASSASSVFSAKTGSDVQVKDPMVDSATLGT